MKLWGGRFAGRIDPKFEKFSESFSVDQRLIHYDLRVNAAYVRALGRARVLRPSEVRTLTRGLEALRRYVESHKGWARGQSSEDIHSWVEGRLDRELGPVARKLRTGRSRNDLIATEMRLFVKDAAAELGHAVTQLLEALLAQARRHLGVVMPGYTHLQPAQPILFSHYLLAYFEMLLRDADRLQDCSRHADELPMGAGALAGVSFPIDRERLARELGFARVARNSLDVTSDRDFVAESLFACSLILIHLSRLAEDLVIYSTPSFGFVELADSYSTGSSLMPQKKNPDVLELIRAKAGRTFGKLAGFLTVLKGLPLAYNRDLQEDKAALFDSVETALAALELTAGVVETLRLHPEKMKEATGQGFLTATDLADALVARGVPFADAHEQLGKLVRYCAEQRKAFSDLSADEPKRFIPLWDASLRQLAAAPQASVESHNIVGGTSPEQVSRQMVLGNRAVLRLKKELGRRAGLRV